MNAVITQDIFKSAFWGLDMALDQFFGGLGVGLFVVSALLRTWFGEKGRSAAKISALTAPVCVVIGGLFLTLHLSQPFRFFLTFSNFNVTSPISWGAWLQAFFGLAVVFHAVSWMGEGREGLRSLTLKLGLPLALATGLYHGFVLMVLRAHPMWNTGSIVVMTLAGFALATISLLVLILAFSGKSRDLEGLQLLRNFTGVAIFIQLLTIFLWMSSLFFGPGEAHFMLTRFLVDHGLQFWGGVVLLGLLLPLAIGGLATLKEKEGNVFVGPAVVSSILLLAGSGLLRYLILIAEQ